MINSSNLMLVPECCVNSTSCLIEFVVTLYFQFLIMPQMTFK